MMLVTHTIGLASASPFYGFPGDSAAKNPPANAGDTGDTGSIPGSVGSLKRKWQPTLFLPGESHGQRSLVGYGLWSPTESDTTE